MGIILLIVAALAAIAFFAIAFALAGRLVGDMASCDPARRRSGWLTALALYVTFR